MLISPHQILSADAPDSDSSRGLTHPDLRGADAKSFDRQEDPISPFRAGSPARGGRAGVHTTGGMGVGQGRRAGQGSGGGRGDDYREDD